MTAPPSCAQHFVEVDSEGSFLQSSKPTAVYRLGLGDQLKIYLPAGHRFAQLDACVRVVQGDAEELVLPFDRNSLGSGVLVYEPRCSGPSVLRLCAKDVNTHQIIEGPRNVIVVQTKLELNGKPLSVEGICLYTVISQKLGPVQRWSEVLRTAQRQKFNVVHFTPIQVLGESRSSYSLADQLTVSPDLSSNGWESVAAELGKIRTELGLLSASDLVLNHTASDSGFLRSAPECGYNELNSPWLLASIELDNAIKNFNQRVVKGDFKQSYGVSSSVENESALNNLMNTFVKECLDPFQLSSWFAIDQDDCCTKFRARNQHAGATPSILPNTEDAAYDALIKHVGTRRNGVVLEAETSAALARNEHELRALLGRVQHRLWRKKDEVYNSIVNGVRGTIQYERVESRKGPVDNTPWNSLVPWYFTPVDTPEGKRLHLANNGWVMGWKASDDFADAGALVYLSRSLVAWSDCVKLRYGAGPEACPVLWDRMSKYCELTAQHFDGVRLDNCHSTPMHVGKYFLERSRRVKPSLFVFAELFTGSFEDDCEFERVLGLDALVREAIQTGSPGDLAWHTQKYSRKIYADLPKEPLISNMDTKGFSPFVPTRCVSLLYDCTHDNETPFQKNRAQDALTCAAFVCASACAIGSTMGFEVLVKSNPTVLADKQVYRCNRVKEEKQANKQSQQSEVDVLKIVHKDAAANKVEVWGSFNSWTNGVPMLSDNAGGWTCTLTVAEYGPRLLKTKIVGKFVADSVWQTSKSYPTTRDERGNENNLLSEGETLPSSDVDLSGSVGIIEGRRVLNALHVRLNTQGFNEIKVEYPSDDFAVVSRHNGQTGEAAYFFIRSHWWKGPDCPACKDVTINGEIRESILSVTLRLEQSAFNQPTNKDNEIRGMSDDKSCVFPLRHPDHHYDPKNNSTYLNFTHFPSASVYVVLVDTKRADAVVHNLLSEAAMDKAFAKTDLTMLNHLLWSCEAEERDRSKGLRGVYMFPETPSSVYAGLGGVADALSAARVSDDFRETGIIKNVQEGDWLVDYHLERIEAMNVTELNQLVRSAVLAIKTCREPEIKAVAVDLLFGRLYVKGIQRLLSCMSPCIRDNIEALAQRLAVASTHIMGRVNTSSLTPEEDSVTMSAGLPFFTTEYMREWGRDTMLALPGICMATGRWQDAKNEILAYAKVVRHGMIPNLLDSGNNPRYNARDAVWYWLEAVQQYVKNAPEGVSLLYERVVCKFEHGLDYTPPAIRNVRDVVHHVLSCHANGISFREWNAGMKIDSQMKDQGFNISVRRDEETGFCIGGNKFNCGTWMDKMGSSEKAGNKGFPSSSRDGAPVELTLALMSCLKWVVEDLIPADLFKYEATSFGLKYSVWFETLKSSFHAKYFITPDDQKKFPNIAHAGTYKDVYGGMQEDEDYFLRCNFPVGFSFAPDAAPKEFVRDALDIVYKRLVCEPDQVGIKTLDTSNYRYRANYVNSDDSSDRNVAHGWNYHQGPEWVWPLGSWFTARLGVAKQNNVSDIYQLMQKLKNVQHWVQRSPWYSLPELMHNNGRVCPDSCQSQAWSLGTFIWFLFEAERTVQPSVWTTPVVSAKDTNEVEVITPSETVATETAC